MGKAKPYCSCRTANIQHRNGALHFVMSGLVEEVGKPDHPNILAGEIHSQPGRAVAEEIDHRIQFLAAGAQVVTGYDEVGGAEGHRGGEQAAILPIPEAMVLARFE